MWSFFQNLRLRLLVGLLLLAFAQNAYGQIKFSPKHIYLLNPGTDRLWGSYIVGVEPLKSPTSFLPVLPSNLVDFRAGRGTKAQDHSQNKDGALQVAVAASAETQVLTVDFFVPALGGQAELKLTPQYDLEELVFLVPSSSPLTVTDSKNRVLKKDNVNFIGRDYIQYVVSNFVAGESVNAVVSGMKIGRGPLWWIALLSALGLIAALGLGHLFSNKDKNSLNASGQSV